MAATGVNKQVLKNTYKKANNKINDLSANVKGLQQAVQTMNQSVWYGGTSANKWYNSVSSAHTSNSKFINAATNLQTSIKKQINSLDRSTNGN